MMINAIAISAQKTKNSTAQTLRFLVNQTRLSIRLMDAIAKTVNVLNSISGSKVYRTDKDCAITVLSNGVNIEVK